MATPQRVSQARDREDRRNNDGPSHLVIRHSKIDSEGCYTTAAITKGEFVVEYTGPRLTIRDADALYDNDPRTYLFGLTDGKHVIDGVGVAAFINHSCEPNCEVDEIDGRVMIKAIRDIEVGEEITYDYNLYDGDLDDESPCYCKSKRCRGSMYSEEELQRRNRALKRRQATAKKKAGVSKPTARKKRQSSLRGRGQRSSRSGRK